MTNTISKIHPPVRTPYRCDKCGGSIEFEKVDITREDGYGDWYLHVVCLCGEINDKDTVEACYNIHGRLTATRIKQQQNATLANALGTDLADTLQHITGDGLYEV